MKILRRFFNRFFTFLKLVKRNYLTLHRRIWGRGWKKFGLAVLITVVVITIFMVVTVKLTSHPNFCTSCHYMKPYFASWEMSSHKDVSCTECHFPPGISNTIRGKFTAFSMLVNYFTGVYKKSKPWAEISDESCMRSGCHQTRVLTGNVSFKQNINFDHAPHLNNLRRNKKLRCTSCHSQIVQGNHMTVTEESCFLCHFKNSLSSGEKINCKTCHDPSTIGKNGGQAPLYDHSKALGRGIECQDCHGDMVAGSGRVTRRRCSYCHAEVEKIALFSETELLHKNHITDHKVECNQCHDDIFHESIVRSDSVKQDCQACHPRYHEAQLHLFSGKGGRGVPSHPSFKFEAGLICRSCHISHRFSQGFELKGESLMSDSLSCERCHGEGYGKVLQNWQRSADKKVNQMERILKSARRIIDGNKEHKNYNEASELLGSAEYNYRLVLYGKSIHNIKYADLLLEKANMMARQGVDLISRGAGLPVFEGRTDLVPGDCSNCHTGVEHLSGQVFGWRFSHFNHLKEKELTCTDCHVNEPSHGQLTLKREDCMGCHHGSSRKQKKCRDCHATQSAIYKSQIPFSSIKVQNVMGEDVSCQDCHLDDNKTIIRSDKQNCLNCHEEDYLDFFDEWQSSAADLLKQLREKVNRDKLSAGNPGFDLLLMLEKDGSRGIHNPELYDLLVAEVLKK